MFGPYSIFTLDKNGKLRNIVSKLDLSGASDLSGVSLTSGPNSGKDLEFASFAELTARVRLAAKTRVLDLRAYGFTAEKAEGLALLDERTLVVINDNDLGARSVIEGDASGGKEPAEYVVTAAGALTFERCAFSGRVRDSRLTERGAGDQPFHGAATARLRGLLRT